MHTHSHTCTHAHSSSSSSSTLSSSIPPPLIKITSTPIGEESSYFRNKYSLSGQTGQTKICVCVCVCVCVSVCVCLCLCACLCVVSEASVLMLSCVPLMPYLSTPPLSFLTTHADRHIHTCRQTHIHTHMRESLSRLDTWAWAGNQSSQHPPPPTEGRGTF